MFRLSHKFELALNDAFQISKLNENSENSYTDIYYFLKRSLLRWRLFKRQSIFMELPRRKYKQLSGTRWVEHRIEALDSHLINLPILIGFCDQQISSHNSTIKQLKLKLEGVRKSVTSVMALIFNSVKLDRKLKRERKNQRTFSWHIKSPGYSRKRICKFDSRSAITR